jgi:hypothetical protein
MAGENSQRFTASLAAQESGADLRAVELHPLKSSAFQGALLRQLAVHSGSLVTLWALGERHFFLTIPHVMCATPTSILLAMV